MKVEQLSLPLETLPPKPTALTQPYGLPFTHNGNLVMRVKPTGFLLNSSIVADVLTRNDCFVVNLVKGTVYVIQGDATVKPVDAVIKVRKL